MRNRLTGMELIKATAIILAVAAICGCINSYHPPPIIDHVNVKLADSNASDVKLHFDVYVRCFSKSSGNYNLTSEVMLYGSRIAISEKKISIKSSPGVQVYGFNYSFSRDRSYEVVFRIMKNNRVYDSYPVEITNLESVPNLEFGVKLKGVDFKLVNLSDSKATLLTELYFVSEKEEKNLSLHIEAKPAGTSLVAAEKWINTNFSRGLNLISTNLTVPENYNYQLVITAWRGDVIEKTWKVPMILNPEKPKPKNESESENFSLQNFVVKPMPRPRPVYTPKKTPGFLLPAAIACMTLLTLRRLRRSKRAGKK